MPQGGEDDVVEKGGVRPGESGLAGFVIEQVGGIARRFLPGFKDFNGETADVHRYGGQKVRRKKRKQISHVPGRWARRSSGVLVAWSHRSSHPGSVSSVLLNPCNHHEHG